LDFVSASGEPAARTATEHRRNRAYEAASE
jgi:hypothetical protein